MPLDTSSYALARPLLRLDGRRAHDLRLIHAQLSTQSSADGSSYLEMGNTKVMCTITGPTEARKSGLSGSGKGQENGQVSVELGVAAFSAVDRRKTGRTDRRTAELQTIIGQSLASIIITKLFPHSTVYVRLHVLSQDGSLLAACLNAATLAVVDAGIPIVDYLLACTVAITDPFGEDAALETLLDTNQQEEMELPSLTIATEGASDRVVTLMMESKLHTSKLEPAMYAAIKGCKQIRHELDRIVRKHGESVLKMSKVAKA